MKKRITALLLCLVMVLSLIPTTVWAAATWTTTKPDGSVVSVYGTTTTYGAESQAIKSGPLYKTKWYQQISPQKNTNNTSYTIPQVSELFTLNEGWKLKYVSVAGNSSGERQPGSSILLSSSGASLVYYFEKETPTTPTIPEPVASNIGEIVTVEDTTNIHDDISYHIADAELAAAEKPSATKRIVTIHSNNYVSLFNDFYKTGHTLLAGSNAEQTVELTYDTHTEKWSASPTKVTFTVECEAEEKPAAPNENDLLKIAGAVHVYCKDANDHSFYTPLKKGTFTTDNSEVEKIGGVYTYTVTLKDGAEGADPYLKESSSYHTEIVNERKSEVTFTWKNNEWKIANVKTDAAVITVECHMPTDEELTALLKGLVTVDCSLIPDHGTHTYDTDVATLKKPLTIQKDDEADTIFCTVELNSTKLGTYVEKYNAEKEFSNSAPHEVDVDADGTDLTVKLIWNAADKKWTVDEGDTFTIITKCKLAPKVPTADELKDLENAVLVQCRGMNAHDPDYQSYQLIDGTYVTEWKDPKTGEIETSDVYWDDGAWRYNLFVKSLAYHGVDGFIPYIEKFNETTGRYHDEYDIDSGFVQLILDEDGVWTVADPAIVFVTCPPAAPTVDELNELDLTVSVSCKNKPTTHRTHSFKLANGYFSTELFLGEDGEYYCRVTLTKADAKHYVSQFDKITSKSHKVSKVEGEILLKWVDNTPSASALALNDGNEEEVPSYTYWELADEDGNTTLNVTATCRKSGGGSTDTKDDGSKKVESGKTFDAGIAMYVGLGVLSVTGSAMVIRKKKEF